jgi:hypothetical protein
MTARNARYSSRLDPRTMPSGMAIAMAIPSPSAQPCIVFPTAVQKSPSSIRSTSAWVHSVTGGKLRLLMSWLRDSNSNSASTDTTPIHGRAQYGTRRRRGR